MNTPLYTIDPQAPVLGVINKFIKKWIDRLIVADDKDRLIGIVGRYDLLRYVCNRLY